MTQHLVLTGIRQDVSAGKCVAATMSPPRQHILCSDKLFTASATIANFLHRAHMSKIIEHPFDSWVWNVPKIQALSAEPRTSWLLSNSWVFGSSWRECTLFLVGNVDNRDQRRIARGRWSTPRRKRAHPNASRSDTQSSRDHAHPL